MLSESPRNVCAKNCVVFNMKNEKTENTSHLCWIFSQILLYIAFLLLNPFRYPHSGSRVEFGWMGPCPPGPVK